MEQPALRQSRWYSVTQLTVLLGLVLAVRHLGVAVLVTLGLLAALFAWGILATLWGDAGLVALPRILRRGLEVGLMVPALAGLAAAFGILSLLLAAILVISHPKVRAELGMLWREHVTRTARERPPSEDHRALSDTDLCAAWQRSHARLRSATTATEMAAVVQLRQDYLDELHRRHPDGLAAWLASGLPPDANPHYFLTRRRRSESPDTSGP